MLIQSKLPSFDALAKGGADAEKKRKALLEELDGKIIPALERLGSLYRELYDRLSAELK